MVSLSGITAVTKGDSLWYNAKGPEQTAVIQHHFPEIDVFISSKLWPVAVEHFLLY